MRFNNLDIKKWGFGFLTLFFLITILVIQVKAADTSDAIAVRIMPNSNHNSIDSWYKQQGYQGAPQKLLVDGYEAIRDGRTVFINAANVDKNKIYTNIYLISYNQDPNIKTVDILGQLVSHWKFNSNVTETGSCSISRITCQTGADCPDSYLCSGSETTAGLNVKADNKGKCVPKAEAKCLNDADCPANIFCDSPKAKIVRDVKRLGQLNEIKDALKAANIADTRYPDLAGGTYIPGNTISTWPSWKETFWSKLTGLSLAVDPINILGDCPGFEATTCWKKDNGNNPDNFYRVDSSGKPILPAGSYAYLYFSEKNGINYSLCGTFETKGLYDTAEGQLSSATCLSLAGHSGISVNTAPEINSSFLDGDSGREFTAYVKATDRENDSISWSLELGSTNFSSWSAAPILRDSGAVNQKTIYAATAGAVGNYPVTLVLKDSRGAIARYPLILKITANKPIIEAENIEYFVNSVTPLSYTFYIQSGNGISSYSMSIKDGAPDVFAGVSVTKTDLGPNRLKIDKSVIIPAGTNLPTDKKLVYQIVAVDKRGVQAVKEISILLKAEAPYLNFDCDNNARVNQNYPISGNACLIGNTKEANHALSYSLSSVSGLNLTTDSAGKVSLSGRPSIYNPSGSPVIVTATNEYGVISSKTFILRINNYCGDSVKQMPNSEGKGGAYNDGLEDCDGLDGTTKNVAGSSISFQYGCSTRGSSANNYPILNGNACIFAPGDQGGGYCGDNLCQFTVDGISLENACNCPVDCGRSAAGVNCNPIPPEGPKCGNGTIDAGEECDGVNLNSKTCENFDANYSIYGLSCNSTCKLVTSGCYPKSCWRNSDCANNVYCKTDATGANYYCTNTHISHGCNKSPFGSTKLLNQCAGSYVNSGGSYGTQFRDDGSASSARFKECQTPCETSSYATDNSKCDWVVSNGRCLITSTCTATSCDDSNPCTDDSCSTAGQCTHTNNSSTANCSVSYGTCTAQGQKTCSNGDYGACNGTVNPKTANCSGKVCGADGCGGSCGTCAANQTCTNGACTTNACVPQCTGKTCGDNGCGGSCGTCAANQTCTNGACITNTCVPQCTGKTCGAADGCNGKCVVNNFGTATCKAYNYYEDGTLTCAAGGVMSFSQCLSGKCGDGNCNGTYETTVNCPADCKAAVCVPKTCSSLGVTCGSVSDGCTTNLSCGTCAANQTCTNGACVTNVCVPSCSGKTCGESDGCSGKCVVNNFGTATCKAYGYYEDGTLTCAAGGVMSYSQCLSGKCGDGNCNGTYETNINCPADCKAAICVPKTCSSLGVTCGSVSDGCTANLACGTCATDQTCTNGTCITNGCVAGSLGRNYGYTLYPAITGASTVVIGSIDGGDCDLTVQCTNGTVSVTSESCTCRCYYKQSGSTFANTVCTECGPGYYGTYDGQTSCQTCGVGYYCPDGGCKTPPSAAGYGQVACPSGYTSLAGSTASTDCSRCGDKQCTGGESCASCPGDCTCQQLIECGNNLCQYGETNSSCPNDCPSDCPGNFKQTMCNRESTCMWDKVTSNCSYQWEMQ